MPANEIEILGLNELQSQFGRYPQIAKPRLQDAVAAGAAEVQKHATRTNVPWRTGNLVQSFGNGITIGELFARISPTANYAIYVNEGTSKMKANPFMARIQEAATPGVNRFFEKAIADIAQAIIK